MYLNNLTTNLAYEVKTRAGTRSHVTGGELHLGPWSPVSAVYLQPGCENMKVKRETNMAVKQKWREIQIFQNQIIFRAKKRGGKTELAGN